ncbi:hypothetical protein HPB47_004454 [Ixodes persulcatus]|uniref:Uncharacterized protein n=1 Tax=Ixodes persulcatus TaxID=34615 RepID=A0AC60PGJ1_IXOPE|nr:hypothetical protein HPB47_004454 [Ixodes persulcatus]
MDQTPPLLLDQRGYGLLSTMCQVGVAPSVLLAKLADSDNTSSSDDDDEGRVYEAKFAELFDAPCTVPKVKAYVSIVRTYSDKALLSGPCSHGEFLWAFWSAPGSVDQIRNGAHDPNGVAPPMDPEWNMTTAPGSADAFPSFPCPGIPFSRPTGAYTCSTHERQEWLRSV